MQEKPFREALSILDRRITDEATGEAKLTSCELGYILDDYSLKLDRLKTPLKDYLVAHYLCLAEPDHTTTENDGSHDHPDAGVQEHHQHQVINPAPLHHLHPGDRVLAVPVNGQQDFVIVARIVTKETLMQIV
jgi:hypothetical protein